MHNYDKKYCVQLGQVSNYVNTPEEVLRVISLYPEEELRFIAEGYADWFERYYGWEVYRRTTGPVSIYEIKYLVARNEVQKMLREIDVFTSS